MPTTSPIMPVVRCTRTVPRATCVTLMLRPGHEQVVDVARVEAAVGNRVGLDLRERGRRSGTPRRETGRVWAG